MVSFRRTFPSNGFGPPRMVSSPAVLPAPPSSSISGVVASMTILALVCVIASYVFPSDRGRLLVCGVAALAVLWAVFQSIGQMMPGYLTPLFFVGSQILTAFSFTLCMITFPAAAFYRHPLPYLAEAPRGCFVALIAPSLGFLLLAAGSKIFRGDGQPSPSLSELVDRLSPNFERLLILAALMQFSLWFTSDERLSASVFAYAMRIVAKPSALVPFLAGYLALKYKRATYVWLAVFGLGVVFSFLTGNRGYAFLPMIPFLIGLFLGLKTWKQRIRIGLILAPVLGVVFFVASVVGERRTETGRFSLSQISLSDLGNLINTSKAFLDDDQAKGDDDVGVSNSGAARMVSWPNIAIPVMTPGIVPYRSFDDFGYEMSTLWTLGRFSGRVYFSNLIANDYGFLVDEETSVEFGVVADGASRAGTLGAVLYGFLAALVLVGLEKLAARLNPDAPGTFLICAIGVSGAGAFDMVRTSLFMSIRTAVISLILLFIVFRVAALLLDSGIPAEAHPSKSVGGRRSF